MGQERDSDELLLEYPNVRRESVFTFSNVLTYLAFEGHAIRIGLELTLSVFLFKTLELLFPWSIFSIAPEWRPIWAWFSSCIIVIIIDQVLLCRSVYIFRRAYQVALAGAYESALLILDQIAPSTDVLVRCPRPHFHILRAEILTLSEMFRAAERELQLAYDAGAKGEQVAIARSRIYRAEHLEESFAKAQHELDSAEQTFGETAIIELERGLLLLEEHKDLWEAKRKFRKVCEMPDEVHYSGDTTSQLARASLEATRLWTGEAEEGLDGLNLAIERLRSLASYIDTLRPLLALLHLERSLYLVTHKEPELGCFDLRMGLALCNTPVVRKKADKIQEELGWRYNHIFGNS